MEIPWLSERRRRREKDKADSLARDELLEVLLSHTPDGLVHSPEYTGEIRSQLDQISAAVALQAKQMVIERRPKHNQVSLLVLDALQRSGPELSLPRIADNFTYMESIGWRYANAMLGLVLRAFPDDEWARDLDLDQQRALLCLEDSKWRTDFTAEGGTKSMHRNPYPEHVLLAAVRHPEHIERIIEIAITRKPDTLEHMEALIATDVPSSLITGAL